MYTYTSNPAFLCKNGNKIKAHHLYSATNLCVKDKADVQPIGGRLSTHTRASRLGAKQPHAALVCRLTGLHPRNPCNYMYHYSFTNPGGTEG